jgi:arabinogalactan oligomer/maltooligosaccharide transport system substrate-binding protein
MKHWFWFLSLLLVLMLAGCSAVENTPTPPSTENVLAEITPTEPAMPTATSEPTPTTGPAQSTIRIWHSWDEPYVPALVEIISDFQENNPNVHFDVLYISRENLLDRYTEETRAGGGPSLLLGPAEWGPVLYEQELVSDLRERFPANVFDQFNQAALGQGRYLDAFLGLPYRLEGVVMYRNRAIIPEPADTFDELVSLGSSFTEGEILGAALERSFFYSAGHLEGIGGSLMDENGLPEFNQTKGVEWINLLAGFELAGPATYLSDRDIELFQEGRVGIVIDGTWNLGTLAEAVGEENLVIDPWPVYGDGALAGYVQSEQLFLNPQVSEHNLEPTLRFMEYISSTEAGTVLAEVGFIPALTGLQLTGDTVQRHQTQAMIALAGGAAYPTHQNMAIYPAHMDQALRSVFELGVSAQDALQMAEDAILNELEQLQITPTPQP